VVNHAQARRLLSAVREQAPSGPRLVAFFAIIYYAALRPEEAVSLRKDNIALPPVARNDATGEWEEPDDNWGELRFCSAATEVGAEWTDDGARREHRHLKSRPEGEWRIVPIAPPLTRILRAHLNQFGTGPEARVFSGIHRGELASVTYRRVWDNARSAALTPAEYASPLARRVYDLRHACVSTWLNGGVPPAQVAEWACCGQKAKGDHGDCQPPPRPVAVCGSIAGDGPTRPRLTYRMEEGAGAGQSSTEACRRCPRPGVQCGTLPCAAGLRLRLWLS
jgi:integrase